MLGRGLEKEGREKIALAPSPSVFLFLLCLAFSLKNKVFLIVFLGEERSGLHEPSVIGRKTA